MYIETIGSAIPVKPMGSVNNNTAAPKMTVMPGTESAVRAESTEGEKQQAKKNITLVQNSNQALKNEAQQGDMRTAEEKQLAEKEKIIKTIDKMNVQLPNSEVKFGIHEKTDRVTIKLIDKDTKKVLKEFPPEKTLDIIAKCMEIAGVLVDEKL